MDEKEQEETYQVTPKGLLGDDICDQIILFMMKNGINAIVWDSENHRLAWTEVRNIKDAEEK